MKKLTRFPKFWKTDFLPARSMTLLLLLSVFTAIVQAATPAVETVCPAAGTIWYVDAGASPGGTGTSWQCAFQDLQDAIDAASSGQEIWVKTGTYLPTKDPFGNASPTDPFDKTFYLKDGVALYGGFAGTETLLAERNWMTNITTLSGDIGVEGDITDNCYHVILTVSDGNTTALDGFTITQGNATGTGNITVETKSILRNGGGGMHIRSSNLAITNCTFTANEGLVGAGIFSTLGNYAMDNCSFIENTAVSNGSGGGIYNVLSDAIITNCSFTGNTIIGSGTGGGMINSQSNLTITNCIFTGNSITSGGAGGGMYNINPSQPTIDHCIFIGNTVAGNGAGGGISNYNCNPIISNCTIKGNTSGFGGGMENTQGAAPMITNCAFTGNLANAWGGGLLNFISSNPTVMNCTFSGNKTNSSIYGGAIHNYTSNPTFINCIVWNNSSGSTTASVNASIYNDGSTTVINYSLFQNLNPSGTGNLNGIPNTSDSNYPAFVTPLDPAGAPSTAGDFHLLGCSPVADVGTATNAPSTDLDGLPRPFGPGIDLGCFERQTAAVPPATWYADADNDGYGNPSMTTLYCTQPSGYVTDNTDCNDNNALEKPGQVWYKDTDSDGYGQTGAATITQCTRPSGYKAASELTATSSDCNDGNAAVNPGASEVCDGIDNNCNSMTDEGVQTTYYRDMDMDGFGNPAVTQQACSQPSGYVNNNTDCNDNNALEKPGQIWYADTDNDGYSNGATQSQCLRPSGYKAASELTATSGDCNDGNAAINPAASEVCDGIDNNCNSMTDEGVQTTYYRDMDNDGFGDPVVSQQACSQPSGYVTNNGDCDDNDSLEHPGQTWYADTDNDGYSSGATQTQCLRPAGYKIAAELTATSGDCNDGNAAINPAAEEVCDGIDNNCDNQLDNGTLTTYYLDFDNDGFGNPASSQQACSPPNGYVTNNTDCDDNDALEHPGQTWYADTDNDGYSNGTTLTQCLRPSGYKVASELTAISGDCNDGNVAINPAASEVCDGIDNNCNSMTDEGVGATYYRDMDNDGFGNPAVSQQACSQPSGYIANNTDCNDNNPLEKPGQTWYADTDNDGYSNGTIITQCLRPSGYKVAAELTAISGDCNDSNAAINPAASEVCDGIDNNCNSMTDEGLGTTYYTDNDHDGYGTGAGQFFCANPGSGYAAQNGDCNDDPTTGGMTNPAAAEVCDGIDNDCDNLVDGNDPNSVDNTPPTAVCLQGTVHLTGAQSMVLPEDVLDFNASSDNCGQVMVTNIVPAMVTCQQVGQQMNVTVTVSDGNGNTANCMATVAVVKDNTLPPGWAAANIGSTANGTSQYDDCTGSNAFTLQTQGYTTNTSDVEHSVYQELCGDADIIAHVSSIFPQGGWAGIQMRESDSQGAKKFTIKTQLGTILRREIRTTTFGPTNTLQVTAPPFHRWFRITRTGSTFNSYSSADGINWVFRSSATISMDACIQVGMFVESINNTTVTQAIIDNVVISGSNANLIQLPGSQIQVEASKELNLTVFPNPTSGQVFVDFGNTLDQDASLTIIDAVGREVLKQSIHLSTQREQLDLSALPSGIYLIKVSAENQPEITKRLVLNRN